MSQRISWIFVISALIFGAGVVIFFKAGAMEVTVAGTTTLPITGAVIPSGERVANLPMMAQQIASLLGGILITLVGSIGLATAMICRVIEVTSSSKAQAATAETE